MINKYDVITIDKDLAVVVVTGEQPENWAYSPVTKRIFPYDRTSPLLRREEKYYKVIATIGKQIEGLPLVVLPEEKHSLLLRIADRIDEMAWAENTSMFDTYIKEIREYATQQKGTYKEEDIQQVSDDCCDSVGYYQVVGKVFQWLIDNDYVVCRKQQPKRFPVAVEFDEDEWALEMKTSNITIHPVNVYHEK